MPSEQEADATVWKRRERAMLVALLVGVVGFVTALTLRPKATTDWLLRTHPLAIVGGTLLLLGLVGGAADFGMRALNSWATSSHDDLTEWDDAE